MSSAFSSRLKELRKLRGLNQKTVGSILGLSDKTISAYENGRNTPNFETLVKISKLFKVSVDYLIGASNLTHSENIIDEHFLRAIPIYNRGSLTQGEVIGYMKLPVWSECTFGFIMPDESCEPVISKGDVALIKRGPALEGDLVLWKGEKLTIRRIYFQEDLVMLMPENSKFKPLVVEDDEIASSLIGVIVGRWQKFQQVSKSKMILKGDDEN